MADLIQLPIVPCGEVASQTSFSARLRAIFNRNMAKRVPAPQPKNVGHHSTLKYDEFVAFLSSVLLDMPSIFERLTYLAQLNKPENQRRLYEDLSCRFPEWGASPWRANAAVAWQHQAMFEEWLRLSPEEKLADLDEWASQFRTSRAELARQWLPPQSIHDLEPHGTGAPEIALFRSDLQLLLPVILAWER